MPALAPAGFETASEKVYRLLRQKLLSGEFAQGEKLSQRKVAALAGVSIIPVIEALVRLDHDGLVEYRPQWGARVPVMTEERLLDLFALREAVECQVARMLAGRLDPGVGAELAALAADLDLPDGPGPDSPAFAALDAAFHEKLAAAAGSPALQAVLLRVRLGGLLAAALGGRKARSRPKPGWHRRLLDAIGSGDPDRAEAAMRLHVQDALRRETTSAEAGAPAGEVAKAQKKRKNTAGLTPVLIAPQEILPMQIPKQGALDFLALGALVHRLDPGIIPFRKATECAIHVSGGEFNCAANLSDCFRLNTGVASAMVDYPIGDLIAERVRAMGVRPFYRRFAHNGVNGPNMATVYSDRGLGVRAPVVFYNRSNEAAAQLKPGDFDWQAIFGAGVRWFHSGGIFASLSETTGPLIIEAMRAAKAAGAVTSFDLNYREKLWSLWGGGEKARATLGKIVENVDVLVGNEEDLQKGLGVKGPDVAAKSKLDTGVFVGMIEDVVRKYPGVKAVATTLREVHSTNRHTWGAVAWIEGKTYPAPTCELDVFDRVGGGDGFAAGLFYGLLAGETPDNAVRLGWAHGALLTTTPGDTTMVTLDQVKAFAQGGSARIQR